MLRKPTKNQVQQFNASDIEEFYSLWRPFEIEILRLANVAEGISPEEGGEADNAPDGGSGGGSRSTEVWNPEQRRYFLEKLFEDREQGSELAKKALSAFSQILNQILSRTQKIIQDSDFGDSTPGEIALESLTNDPTFLRRANAYSVSYQNWLLDYLGRNPDQLEAAQSSQTREDEVASNDASVKSSHFAMHSSQEWTAVLQCLADGKYDRYYTGNEQAGTLRHSRPGTPYHTEARLLDAEREAGYGIELLKAAALQLDLDAAYIVLYMSQLLAPPAPLQPNTAAVGWVDLDDVARMTLGGYASSPKELVERREKVWNAIRFGARWFVVGDRSIPYFDKQTGEVIDTELHTSLWQVMKRQEPTQPALFPNDAVPLRVELVVSREWTELTTRSDTAQFLSFGEVLGAIPGGQATGAWSRSLGMAYMVWARTKMLDALDNKPTMTRRQLLDQFPAKTAPYQSLLGTTHAKRIFDYWRGAEDILKERELIEFFGKRPEKPTGAKGWQEWLDSSPPWIPGRLLRDALEHQARNAYKPISRQLNPAKRRGRPRKKG